MERPTRSGRAIDADDDPTGRRELGRRVGHHRHRPDAVVPPVVLAAPRGPLVPPSIVGQIVEAIHRHRLDV
jgi:hypothetical protein